MEMQGNGGGGIGSSLYTLHYKRAIVTINYY